MFQPSRIYRLLTERLLIWVASPLKAFSANTTSSRAATGTRPGTPCLIRSGRRPARPSRLGSGKTISTPQASRKQSCGFALRPCPAKSLPWTRSGVRSGLAIRTCSNILIWCDSFSARRFRLAGKRARLLISPQISNRTHYSCQLIRPPSGGLQNLPASR